MGRSPKFFLLLFAALFFLSSVSCAEVAVPPLGSHVNDLANLLSQPAKLSIDSKLKAFEETKGSQVVVLTIKSTEGEAIEQFAIRVAEKWKIGRKKIDDGVILVVAKEDRALRIEVGYGLEGALSDATSKQIIENFILPEFRTGNFDSGITAGVDAILKKLSGEELPIPQTEDSIDWVLVIVIVILVLMSLYQIAHPGRGRYYRSGRSNGGWGSSGGWSGGGGFSGGGGGFGGGGASGKW